MDVIISHWLSHELEEGGGHFGAGVLELKEISFLLFGFGAPLDWFCASPFTRIFSYSKKGVELLMALVHEVKNTLEISELHTLQVR